MCCCALPRCARFRGLSARACCLEALYTFLDNLLDFMDCAARLLGPCLLLGAAVVISLNTYLYFTYVAPTLGPAHSPYRAACTAAGVFTLLNLLYNYAVCVCSDPGHVAGLPLRDMWLLAQRHDPAYRLAPLQTVDDLRWCDVCNSVKPRRVHHCSVCRVCVLKMDHHCPWVNACIGVRTYPYFVRLLVWAILGTAFMTAVGAQAAWLQLTLCDASAAQQLYPARNPAPINIREILSAVNPAAMASLRGSGGGRGRALLALPNPAITSFPSAALSYLAAQGVALFSYAASFPPYFWAILRPTSSGCIKVYLITYAVTTSLGLALCLLAGFHLYLTSTGQSSIEFYKNRGSGRKEAGGGGGWRAACARRMACCLRCCRSSTAKSAKEAQAGAAAQAPPPPPRHVFDAGSCEANWRAVFRTPFWGGRWLLPPSWVGLGAWGMGESTRTALWQCALVRRWCGRRGVGVGGAAPMRKRNDSWVAALRGGGGDAAAEEGEEVAPSMRQRG